MSASCKIVANGLTFCVASAGDWGAPGDAQDVGRHRRHGEAVLCIGGSGMPTYAWDIARVSRLLDAGYRVITFDSRGVGASDGPPGPYSIADMAADTAAHIEGLDVAPCRLLGVSLGGFIAEELAITRPELVRAAVLWASAGRATAFAKVKAQAERELFERVDPPTSYELAEALMIAVPAEVLRDDDETVQGWAELLAANWPWSGDGRQGQFAAAREWFLDEARPARWASIACPCLVVSHEHDLYFPPRVGREQAAAMPNSKFLEIPGLAHRQLIEAADTVMDAVLDFFEGRGRSA